MKNGDRRLFFISYAHGSAEDEELCARFAEELGAAGHDVFFDRKMSPGTDWAVEIERQLRACDFFLLLLSAGALDSSMVMQEVERVCARRKAEGAPIVLTIHVKLEGKLPYRWAARLDAYQWQVWRSEDDFEPILRSIKSVAGEGAGLPPSPTRSPPANHRRQWILGGAAVAVVSGLMSAALFHRGATSCVFIPSYAMQTVVASEYRPVRLATSDTCDAGHFYCIDLPGAGRFPLPPNGVLLGVRPRSLTRLLTPHRTPSDMPGTGAILDPAQLQLPLLERFQDLARLCEEGSVLLTRKNRDGRFVACTNARTITCERIEEVRWCRVSDESC